jgi:hypothetical protein
MGRPFLATRLKLRGKQSKNRFSNLTTLSFHPPIVYVTEINENICHFHENLALTLRTFLGTDGTVVRGEICIFFFNTVEDVEKVRTDICGRRTKFKMLNTRVPTLSFQQLYVPELVIYL